jgi:Outer membrane efflux protein
MQSIYLSRSPFGCSRISLITVALFVGSLALAGNAGAQEAPSSQRPVPESPAMAEYNAGPTSLRELTQEAEQKNPQIAASFHAWQASRNVPKQVSALPEIRLSVQQFSVGSPRPFAGYSNSDFAYIGFGVSREIPYALRQAYTDIIQTVPSSGSSTSLPRDLYMASFARSLPQ